jgi:hypothetical protein
MAAQLVADIIQQKVMEIKQERAEIQETFKRKKRHAVFWYLAGLLPLLLGLTIWNLSRRGDMPEVFTPEELDASVRFKVFLAAQAVQAYRDSLGRWPASLAAVGMGDEGLVYQRIDSIFTVTDTSGSVPLVYHAGESLAPFANGYTHLSRRRPR